MLSFSFIPKPGKKFWLGRENTEDVMRGVFEGRLCMAFRKERSNRLPGGFPETSIYVFVNFSQNA